MFKAIGFCIVHFEEVFSNLQVRLVLVD